MNYHSKSKSLKCVTLFRQELRRKWEEQVFDGKLVKIYPFPLSAYLSREV